jgi:hypothetical protein
MSDINSVVRLPEQTRQTLTLITNTPFALVSVGSQPLSYFSLSQIWSAQCRTIIQGNSRSARSRKISVNLNVADCCAGLCFPLGREVYSLKVIIMFTVHSPSAILIHESTGSLPVGFSSHLINLYYGISVRWIPCCPTKKMVPQIAWKSLPSVHGSSP